MSNDMSVVVDHPTLRFEPGSKVVPGDRIGSVRQVLPGPGTYAKGGNIYASVLGRMELAPCSRTPESDPTKDSSPTTVVSIRPKRPLASSQVISVGQLVLGRVSRVAAPQATLEIIAMEGTGPITTTSPPFPEGSIAREECVKSGTTPGSSSREVHECFQPGDMVLAKVLSLGDSRRYFLTTAESELGVIHAVCYASGTPMIPCSWKEMECPDSGVKEPRKCAKPRKVVKPLLMEDDDGAL